MQRERTVLLFLITGLLLALPGLWFVFTTNKLAFHAIINSRHTPGWDLFFIYATHLGDGLMPTVLALALLFLKDVRSALMVGLSCGSSAIIVQFLKRQVFSHMDRPGRFREGLGDMHWVADIELNNHFSFPSGHSTAAFSMCFALAVILGRPKWGLAMALIGGVLAFSRVYLSQHFTQDIIAGAALGTVTAYFVYRWLYVSPFSQRPWLYRRVGQRPNQ
jgi:membrane-associated phospholipid phosphatase